MNLNIIDLKREKYGRALKIQEALQQMRIEGTVEDTFILVEHPPVLTMGRRGKEGNVLAPRETLERERIETVWINRGGDVTYHGPGQIVGYPIIHLAKNDIGIRVFVENIQQTIMEYLQNEHGIIAEKKSGVHTGVWVGGKKICAIGISVSRNVTMHGFAFNVNTNLAHFSYINPCGLGVGSVTSLRELTGSEIDFEAAKEKIIKYFCASFDAQPVYKTVEELLGEI